MAQSFIRGLLDDPEDPQLPQYNAQGGWDTAANFGRIAAGMTTPGAVADAAGLLGGPSIRQNVSGGNYLDALLQGVGVIPGVGGVAKGLLGAGALYKAAKMGAPEIKAALDPSVVRMFLGPNAKTADKAALAEAEALHSSGASREDIIDKTNWFKGVDGKWRFEVPDNEASLTEWTRSRHMPASVNFMEQQGKMPTAMGFNDYIEHPTLDRAYWPLNEDAPNVFFKQSKNIKGSYDGPMDTITISVPYSDSKSTALHEVQHAIQNREGFARGGSPSDPSLSNIVDESKVSDFRKAYKENPDFARHVDLFNSNEHNQAIQQSNRYYRENFQPKFEEIAKQMIDLPRGLAERDAIRDAWFVLRRQADSELMAKFPIIKQVEQANAHWQNKIGQSLFEPQNSVLEPYEAYRRLAGEVEARTTQKRMDMTAEERKARYPWLDYDVPENQQIVKFRGLLGLQEASQAGDKTGMALASAGLIPGAGVAEKVAAKVAERGLSEKLPALVPSVEHWARQLADNLANRAGDGYNAAHSLTPFGYSSYVKGPGGEFGPTVRISDHFANPANRPDQLMFGKDNFDEDAAWRHLTNNPSTEELDLIAQRTQAAEDMSAKKRISAQQAYDAEYEAGVARGSKNPHKRAVSVARQIKGDFDPAR